MLGSGNSSRSILDEEALIKPSTVNVAPVNAAAATLPPTASAAISAAAVAAATTGTLASMKHLGQSSSINHRSNNSLVQPQHQQSQRLHQSNVLSQGVVHTPSQSSSGSMVPHQAPTAPSTQHPLPPSMGPSSSFHHMQPAGMPSAPVHSTAVPSSAGAPNYHHHHHHHHHQAAAMLTLAVSNPPTQLAHQHHQQNINLNVNHHLISAPIVVDFSNMTVNCVQLGQENQQPHLHQQPPSLVGTGHNVGPMGNNGGGMVPGSNGGRMK